MIWRCDFFVSQGIKADHAIYSVTGRNNFNLNNALLNVTENDFTCAILMFTKFGQHMKASSLSGHKLLSDACIAIENNKVIDTGGPAQQEVDAYSS